MSAWCSAGAGSAGWWTSCTRADLVRREVNPDDARSAYAVITAEGDARFRQAAPVYVGSIEEEFGGDLTVAELTALGSALQRVLTRLDRRPGQQ